MSGIKREAHLKAMSDLLEVISIASAAALVIDFLWCISEMTREGMLISLVLVALGLFISATIVIVAIVKYHSRAVKEHLKAKLIAFRARKELEVKAKEAHKRRHHL